jgi:hypothetical protein
LIQAPPVSNGRKKLIAGWIMFPMGLVIGGAAATVSTILFQKGVTVSSLNIVVIGGAVETFFGFIKIVKGHSRAKYYRHWGDENNRCAGVALQPTKSNPVVQQIQAPENPPQNRPAVQQNQTPANPVVAPVNNATTQPINYIGNRVVITSKDKSKTEGMVVKETDNYFVIEVDGSNITIWKTVIEKIEMAN